MDKLQIAKEAAKLGAKCALKYYQTNLKVELKEDHTPVTVADKDTEQKIKEYILSRDASAKFVGEELGGDYKQDEYWLIDPIDGTIYFSHGIPLWGTLITYMKNGKAEIGVSYIPFVDELLYAQKGRGAFLNDKKVHVSSTNVVENAFISHGSIKSVLNKFPGFMNLAKQALKTKGVGDSYGYHLLASGRIEAKFDGAAMPFDVAGMNLVIEEAGGKVTNYAGEACSLHDKDVIATNGILHAEMLEIMHKHD